MNSEKQDSSVVHIIIAGYIFTSGKTVFQHQHELSRKMFSIIIIRAVMLLLLLNLAGRLGLFPQDRGSIHFLTLFNCIALILTAIFLILWKWERDSKFLLYLQIGVDLVLTTILVGYTRGIESSFISLYLLIIIYCSLTLGRNGGIVGATLSTILYAGVITASGLDLLGIDSSNIKASQATFRIAAHALGFWSVAFLGTYLHQRLRRVEWALKEKIDSFTRLQHLNEHIISSIRSGLITTDLDGNIAVFNSAAGELVGRDPQNFLHQPIQTLISNSLWTQILHTDLLSNAKPMRHEEWIDLPGGDKRYLGFSVSPLLDQHHKLLGYIISFQDLTDIIRLEEEVRLKDRMAAVGRMAAGIAHEIRNPLTAIRGSVEILHSHANLPDKDKRLLNILIRESDRLNKFIEDFLNYARPRKYEKRPLDLVPVLSDSVMLLRNSPEIREKYSVTLNIEDTNVMINGSSDQLNQVFWNLAQNAVRAMPDGGELKISINKTSNGIGRIVFKDNGIGMSREEQEQLFQPLNSGFKGGLGLGLSIIFQIMEDHRGKIAFESEKGKGTSVILSFLLESPSEVIENIKLAAAG
jgi:two-component system, NtrC family, sensor histidine kinase PilS